MRFAAVFGAVTASATSHVSAGGVSISPVPDLKGFNASATPILHMPILNKTTGHDLHRIGHKLSLIETGAKDETDDGDEPSSVAPLSSVQGSTQPDSSSADASQNL